MSCSNYCFLTCLQISQETSKVVCYSHLVKNFPKFFVIHTVKSFSVVNEAEVDVFLEFSCFFNDPLDASNLISGSSAFSKTSLHICNFSVHVLLKPSLKNLDEWYHKDHCNENLLDCPNFSSYGNPFLFFLPLKSINYHWQICSTMNNYPKLGQFQSLGIRKFFYQVIGYV